jgi:hypothetical protein
MKDAVTVRKAKTYTLANTDGTVISLIFYANSASTYDDHVAEFEKSVETVKLDNPLDISDSAAFYENEAISKHSYKVSSETVTINGTDYGLHIATNSTLSDFNLDQEQKTISFSVDGREGTFGAIDIEISKVLDGPYSVIIDGQPTEDVSLVVDRTTNVTFMTVGYSHSVHEITIIGTNVVPEFPLSIVVVVFASVVAAGFILGRKQSLF